MDELQAKKILDALAKKMHADSVYIYLHYNLDETPTYSLTLAKDNKKYSLLMRSINDDEYELWHEVTSFEDSFCSFLNNLKNHKIIYSSFFAGDYNLIEYDPIYIYSIEQLMIELELDGYLDLTIA